MVYNCRIAPEYFLDVMDNWEVVSLLKQHNLYYQEGWEKIRFSAYIDALSRGAKLKQPKDLITFNWEKAEEVKRPKPTPEQLKVMTEEMTKSFENFKSGNVEPVNL